MAERHRIFVFAKLKSFQKAAEENVKALLEAVVEGNENLNGMTTVDSFRAADEKQRATTLARYATSTAVVVIDARQSRVCLRPERRDRSIDHRQELDMLHRTSTKPKGSILIVIYGDRKSRHMKDKVIADIWLKQWKFGDKWALKLAKDRRIFSVFEEFNSDQVDCIEDYLMKLPLIPSPWGTLRTGRDSNVLVIGQRGDAKEDLHCNPFLANRVIQWDRHFTVEVSRPLFSADSSRQSELASIQTYFVNGFPTLQLCEGAGSHTAEDALQAKTLRSYGVDNMFNLYCVKIARMLWFNRFPKFDRVILLCHCEDCFAKVIDNEDRIGIHLTRQLEKLGITLSSNARVLPLIQPRPTSYTEKTFPKAWGKMEDLMNQDICLSEEQISLHKDHIQAYMNDNFLMTLYAMYVFQPSSARGFKRK